MATIRTLAAEYDAQPYEIAASLDLGADYSETTELDATTEAEYREILDIMREQDEREPAAKCTTEVSTDGLVWEVIAIDAPDEDGPLTLDEARFAADEAGTQPGLFVRLTLRDREDRILAQSPAYEVPEPDFVAEYHEVDPTITIIHDGEDTDLLIIGSEVLPAIIDYTDPGEEWRPDLLDEALTEAGWVRVSEWDTITRTATVRRA